MILNGADRCRYHGIEKSSYPLPNDDEEVYRLDRLQNVARTVLGANILAPISQRATHIVPSIAIRLMLA